MKKEQNKEKRSKDQEWEEKKSKGWQRQSYFNDEKQKEFENMQDQVKTSGMLSSFNHAFDGILYAAIRERNFRFDLIIAALVFILALILDFTKIEFALLSMAVFFVLVSELFNTCLENICDLLVGSRFVELVKIVKDVAAGATLLSALNAVIVGYMLFYDRLYYLANEIQSGIKLSPPHLAVSVLVLIIVAVVLLKAFWYRGHGSPLQGGSFSGHAALSFGLATVILFSTESILISIIGYSLALLVTHSRYEGQIHTVGELILGAALGITIAVIVFVLFGGIA